MKDSTGPMRTRLALCNEVLMPMPFEAQCAHAAALGYRALELAPFTVADDPAALDDRGAAQLVRIAADAGIAICGLHWLLVAPGGLSITTPDAAVRRRTVDFMRRLVELCAHLGAGYLVHGSPAQRRIEPGQTHRSALEFATDSWASAGEAAQRHGVVYCIEPLSRQETEFVNGVAEAVAIVEEVGSPALRTMLDCRAARLAEAEPVPDLIARYVPSGMIRHVHLNDRNGRAPGQGADPFAPVLAALGAAGYAGDVGIEPFSYDPDGPTTAARAIGYLAGIEEALAGGRALR